MTTGDVSRLPKWAQEKITDLERNVRQTQAELDRERAEHNGQHTNTNLVLQGRVHYPDMNLPRDAGVHFYMNPPTETAELYTNGMEIRHSRNDPNTLHVNGFGGAVLVKPQAANALNLILEGRF